MWLPSWMPLASPVQAYFQIWFRLASFDMFSSNISYILQKNSHVKQCLQWYAPFGLPYIVKVNPKRVSATYDAVALGVTNSVSLVIGSSGAMSGLHIWQQGSAWAGTHTSKVRFYYHLNSHHHARYISKHCLYDVKIYDFFSFFAFFKVFKLKHIIFTKIDLVFINIWKIVLYKSYFLRFIIG